MTTNTSQQADPATPEYLSAPELEKITGTPASTWRYWAHIDEGKSPDEMVGPPSFRLGRRRVWKRSTALAWLEAQEKAALS